MCAAVFVRTETGSPKIYLAKNGGLDVIDVNFLKALQNWMRELARSNTAQVPKNETTLNHIFEHNLEIINYRIDEIAKITLSDLEALTRIGWVRDLMRTLHGLCDDFRTDPGTTTDFRPIVDIADTLRNVLK